MWTEAKQKSTEKLPKASTTLKTGDILELEYYDKYFKFEILEVPEGNVSKDKSNDLVKVLDSRGIAVDLSSDKEILE